MSIKNIFSKTEILSVLSLIDKEYNNIYHINTPKNIKLMKSYTKMATIATGGWVEDGLKELSQMSIDRLSEQKRISKLTESIYGFSYNHFYKYIIYSFGPHGLEFIESSVGDTKIFILKSSLGKLKEWRDHAAHSHRIILQCNPSQVITEFNKIFPILKEIEKYAKEYKKKHF